MCSVELKSKITNPSAVNISGRSSLVVKGEGLTIESLDLDGALVIECEAGATGVIRNLVVRNKGWVKVPVDDSESSEVIKMRGYRMDKLETRTIVFKKDGSIQGDYQPDAAVEVTEGKAMSKEKFGVCARDDVKNNSVAHAKPNENDADVPKPACCNGQKEKGVQGTNSKIAAPVGNTREVVDFSKPASTEQKEKDTLCGGACVIL